MSVEVRAAALAGELLEACVEHARSRGGSVMWCNGRLPARAFYGRHGFAVARGPFEIAGLGPHLELRRRLATDVPGLTAGRPGSYGPARTSRY